ncbi:hypothetical protein Taro_007059, partial [Colocasia esculenta]|nr:hypothetical protein [Colocasia esculenta]
LQRSSTLSNHRGRSDRREEQGTRGDRRDAEAGKGKMTEAVVRKKPGMVSVKEMPLLQDGPPPGGFPPVRYARRIPSTGPSAMAIFVTAFGVFAWGMYQVGQGNKIRRKAAKKVGEVLGLGMDVERYGAQREGRAAV